MVWSFIKENVDIISPLILTIVGLINLWIAFMVFRFNKKNAHSKVSIRATKEIMKEDFNWRSTALYDQVFTEGIESFKGSGFPLILEDQPRLWTIKLMNRGDSASLNITLRYSLIIEKSEFDLSEDQTDVLNQRFEVYKKYDDEVNIPYIGANDEKSFVIINLQGDFPKARLIVRELKTESNKFIKNPVIIDEYIHTTFSYLSDNVHYKAMLGIRTE